MFSKKIVLLSIIVGFVISLVAGFSVAKAVRTDFTGWEHYVMNLMPPDIEVLPSGNMKIKSIESLYYEDTDNLRINGYGFVSGSGIATVNGIVQYGGIFIIREKLDSIPLENLIDPNYSPKEIVYGNILWEGTWRKVGSGENSYIKAVLHSPDGSKLFYFLNHNTGETNGYILEPSGYE